MVITASNIEQKPSVSVVIPIYNESSNLFALRDRLQALQDNNKQYQWSFLLINDGSTDDSAKIIKELAQSNVSFQAIFLSRNFGHQAALSAGLDHAEGDYIAVIDGDLQDPPELIPEMIAQLEGGLNMVYGQRISRAGEGIFKKLSAKYFYRIMSALTDVAIPVDTGDFRACDRKMLNAVRQLREYHRFLRGMFAWSGFAVKPFPYERKGRHAGVTKFSLRAMVRFAENAIFSFSVAPLKVALYCGVSVAVLGLLGILYIFYQKLFYSNYIIGISAILSSVLVIGGIQLIVLGVIGAYIGKIFEEVKRRPLYIIDHMIHIGDKNGVLH
jgi:glycosyltransferase involved in cell wall biosynthesis